MKKIMKIISSKYQTLINKAVINRALLTIKYLKQRKSNPIKKRTINLPNLIIQNKRKLRKIND